MPPSLDFFLTFCLEAGQAGVSFRHSRFRFTDAKLRVMNLSDLLCSSSGDSDSAETLLGHGDVEHVQPRPSHTDEASPRPRCVMAISDLLCLPFEGRHAAEEEQLGNEDAPQSTRNTEAGPLCQSRRAVSKPPSPQQEKRVVAVVPDNQRKRPYRMSGAQKLQRRAHQEHESRVFNLSLDINDLRQHVQYLLECRDLQLTKLFVGRLHLEEDVLVLTEQLVKGFSRAGPTLTATQRSRCFSRQHMASLESGDAVHDMVLSRGPSIFSHPSWATVSTKVLCFVEEEEEGCEASVDAAEIRQWCGSNGCVVETNGLFTARIKREMIVAFFPQVLCDEALVSRLIGYCLTCPIRLVLYFDEHRCVMHQVAQIDVLASLNPIRLDNPRDFAALVGTSTDLYSQ